MYKGIAYPVKFAQQLFKRVMAFVIVFSVLFNSYGQTAENFKSPENVNFSDKNAAKDYQQFLENQNTPLLTAIGEAFSLNETVWHRKYGEKEYVLHPIMQDISEYNNRIRQLDDEENGIIKSNLHFLNVELTTLSKSLLSNMNIQVPDYVQNNVNVWLPEIDIDVLIENGVNINILESYGKNEGEIINTKGSKATIWSENWEVSSLPSSTYPSVNTGTGNCEWDDVSCFDCGGSWSIWCAGYGSDCNADCSDYKNNMDAEIYKSSSIPVGCYTNRQFNFDLMINTPVGTADKLQLYYDKGSGWTLWDEWSNDVSLCTQQAYSLTGSWNNFRW